MKTLKDFLLNDSVLDSIKDKLSPELWAGNKLKPTAKSFIINRLKTWLKTVYNKEPSHIFLLGSMAGYQYSPAADVDVNFVIDVSDKRVEELAKLLPNGHNLPNTNHPVNYYVSNEVKKEWKDSGPVYDVLKERWVERPSKERPADVVQNYRAVSEVGRLFVTSAEHSIAEFNTDVQNFEAYESYLKNADGHDVDDIKKLGQAKLFEIVADIDSIFILKHLIKALRKEAFSESPIEISIDIKMKDQNSSMNNLIFKYLEQLGYLDKFDKILDQREKWTKKFSSF